MSHPFNPKQRQNLPTRGDRIKKYYSVIYTYTTPLRKSLGRVKVGSARRKASSAFEAAKLRIAQQSTAISSDDPAEILEVFDVNDLCETGDKNDSLSKLRTLEKTFLHKNMTEKGMHFAGDQDFEVKDSSEWFFADTVDDVVKEVKSQLNQRRHGVARPNSYTMRPEQSDCVDKAVSYFDGGGKKFLINAIMRFGKIFVSYQTIKALNYKRVLILTYKPAVGNEWRDELNNHVDFDDYNFTSAKDFGNKPIEFGNATLPGLEPKCELFFGSFQDLINIDKNKWKNIFDVDFDLIILDEQHFGTNTELAKATLSKLSCDRFLDLSGTPLKSIMSGEYLPEEMFSWSYVDEQRCRRDEENAGWPTEIYRWLPQMNIHTFTVSDEVKKGIVNNYSDDEGFSMTKMLASDDGETFLDPASVKLFLDNVFGVSGHKNMSPYRTDATNHSLWFCPPCKKSVDALCKMVKKHYPDYEVINVSGDNVTNLNKVKEYILRYDKTITITCGRFNTGVTVPEWDMVIMLDDGKSPESYFQTIFRAKSPDQSRRKEKCIVVDYNPQRYLEMVYRYCEIVAKDDQSTDDAVREFLDFAPVMDHVGNKLVQVDAEKVLSAISESGDYVSGFFAPGMLNWRYLDKYSDEINHIDVIKFFNHIIQIANNDLVKGKNYVSKIKTIKTKDELDNLSNRQIQDLKNKANSMLAKIPTYLYLSDDVNSVSDITTSWSEVVNYDELDPLFEQVVGVTNEVFASMIGTFINKNRLNRCIVAFNQYSKCNQDINKIVKLLSVLNTGNTMTMINYELAREMVDKVTLDWSDSNLKICDPFCGSGMFLLACAEKLLEYGHTPEHIVTNMLYGYDIDIVQTHVAYASLKRFCNVESNIEQRNTLEGDFDMRFDLVIGNPPYQDSSSSANNKKLWHEFIKVAIENGQVVAFVTPSSWVNANTEQMNRIRKILTSTGHVSIVNDTTHYFNVGVKTCYWIWNKGTSQSINTVVYGTPYPLHKQCFMNNQDKLRNKIYNKIKSVTSIKFVSFNDKVIREDLCADGKNVIYFSGEKKQKTNKCLEGVGVGKFVAPFSASPHNVFWTTDATGMLNQNIICNEDEAKDYKMVWNLNVVRFFMKTYNKTSGFTPAVRNSLIPDLRGYDDSSAYKLLDLTDEEIIHIEQEVL